MHVGEDLSGDDGDIHTSRMHFLCNIQLNTFKAPVLKATEQEPDFHAMSTSVGACLDVGVHSTFW